MRAADSTHAVSRAILPRPFSPDPAAPETGGLLPGKGGEANGKGKVLWLQDQADGAEDGQGIEPHPS